MTQVFAIVYVIILLFFGLNFLYNWYRYRRQLGLYKKYAYLVLAFVVITEGLSLISVAGSLARISPLQILLTDVLLTLRLIAFTVVGTYYCNLRGQNNFPLLSRRFGPRPPIIEATPLEAAPEQAEALPLLATTEADVPDILPLSADAAQTELQLAAQASLPTSPLVEPVETNAVPAEVAARRVSIQPRAYLLSIAAVVFGAVAYTFILFRLTAPQLSRFLQPSQVDPTSGVISGQSLVMTLLLVLQFAVNEEIIFRLGIQSYLLRKFKLRSRNHAS